MLFINNFALLNPIAIEFPQQTFRHCSWNCFYCLPFVAICEWHFDDGRTPANILNIWRNLISQSSPYLGAGKLHFDSICSCTADSSGPPLKSSFWSPLSYLHSVILIRGLHFRFLRLRHFLFFLLKFIDRFHWQLNLIEKGSFWYN